MIDRIAPSGLTTGSASLAARSTPRMPSDDRPDDLWWTDGGALLCTTHLGASARYTGHDISGQRIEHTTEIAARARLGRYIQPSHACCEACRAIQRSADKRGT